MEGDERVKGMIYADEIQDATIYPNRPKCFKGNFCHLSADTEGELLEFAKSIGLPINWLQYSGTPKFHFDLTGKWLKLRGNPRVVNISCSEYFNKLKEKVKNERSSKI